MGEDGPRDRILAVAEEQFRRFGYRRTTVEAVAAAAGCGKGSVYLHFSSKQELYLAVVESSVARFVDRAATALSSQEPVPWRMRRLVEVTIDHYGDDELLWSSMVREPSLVDLDTARRAARIQRDRVSALIADVLRQGITAGTIRPDLDPDKAGTVLFEIGWTTVRSALERETEIPLAGSLEILNSIVDRGISVRPGGSHPAAE